MSIIRFDENPLIVPGDVKPSRSDFEVVCAFNAGCIRFNDEILLLMRVAERPPIGPDYVIAPILHPEDPSQGIDLFRVDRSNPAFEEIDSRLFSYKGKTYLTSISHLRIARSRDGRNFIIDERPAIFPEMRDEEYGVEDPRITQLGDKYYINYTAVSGNGITTALAVTKDFVRFERRGVIFAPENRDVTIFPEKIGGRYVCYHRPVAKLIGGADIWLAGSPDLINWGNHQHVCGPRSGMWDEYKIGGGAVPIKTEKGWLEIYHG
ncbi:MAG: glycosidase, partial [Planctomycetota bacterium]